MNKLSERIENLPASATLSMAAKARELKNSGVDVISLSLGEPDFNTPEFVKEAAIKAIEENYHSYPPVDGYLELKKAICEKFLRDNNLNYEPSQIVVSTGAKQSIANVCMSLLSKGDEVLLPAPYWVSYSAIVTLCEAKFKIIPSSLENGFKITPAQLKSELTSKTRLIMFNSPNNPSGIVYSEKELTEFAEILEDFPSTYVLSDEIYEHIIYGENHFSFANLPNMFDRTITVNGLAKAFSMTGWRIGYIGAPEFIAKACNKFQGQITSAANCIAQRSAITALKAPVSKIKYMIDEFSSRKELIFDLVSKIPGFKLLKPSGAFYLFPNISFYFGKVIKGKIINDASDFAMTILEEANVATVAGDSFGNKNCLRISYAASKEEIIEAVSRIKNLLANN
jgi:aspartate aminotransferase